MHEPKNQEQDALVSINTSNATSNPSNEEDDFDIDLNLMDTDQVLITNKTP